MTHKIAIIGSNSFIAKNLSDYYYGQEIALFNREHTKDVCKHLNDFQPDVIINCAAEIYNSETMFESNIVLLYNILEYCKQNLNTRFIQIGSSSEYGTSYQIPLHEDLKLSPKDMYQATKGAGTLLCQGYSNQFGVDVAIVRPFSVYGRYEKPHKLFPSLWRVFKKDEHITIHEGVHDFVYIDDFVRAIDQLLSMCDFNGDVINVGSGIQYTNSEIVQFFKNVEKKQYVNVTYASTTIRSFDRKSWVCDTKNAEEKYGIVCDTPIEAGIKLFLDTANY